VSIATGTTFRWENLAIFEILLAAFLSRAFGGQPALFESRQLTPAGEYTFGIEGPAVDAAGTLYVPNYARQGTIGRLTPGALKSEFFLQLPAGSIGNAIRFDGDGRMFVADYRNHNVFVIERGQIEARVYFHSDAFNQPNDLTIAADGTIYASDPNWKRREGRIWRLARGPDGNVRGEVMWSTRKMGTTNGIDLSPDGKTLYVGESETRELWAYDLEGEKLVAPRLVKRFNDFSLDGLRTDIDGRLFVARILKGTVALLSPDGKVEREIVLRAREPTNLAFGGPDGKTVFVTQRQGGFIEGFRVDRPGREFCLRKMEPSDPSCRARGVPGAK
jgi:sugar lactone lactonase YvrE